LRYFVILGTLAIPAGLALVSLKPYQMQRITGFLSAWDDFDNAPYQLKQSIIALGSGGLDGVGIGKGRQKLSFLPEANTDFVFAVVGEELGLIATLAVVLLWIGFYVAGLRMLRRLPARSFESIVGFTLLTQIVLQAVLNVAVVTGLVPPKGISHPFLSSGGSNLVMSLVTIGVLVSLSKSNEHAP
jgi:cell division protein FtsW